MRLFNLERKIPYFLGKGGSYVKTNLTKKL
jgi:hypothetical protein